MTSLYWLPVQRPGVKGNKTDVLKKIQQNSFFLPNNIFENVQLVVKNPPTNTDLRDVVLIPGSGRSPGERQGNPLQDSCLENPMDREAWQATVHRVAKSQTQLKRLSTQHAWQKFTCTTCLLCFLSAEELKAETRYGMARRYYKNSFMTAQGQL